MAIIYLTQSVRQVLRGLPAERPECPADAAHPLVRNGTFPRQADTAHGVVVVRIQRYLCRSCHTTYSALPYDCQPYTTWTWPLVLALLVWRSRGWSLRRCLRWLQQRQINPHPRTLSRWTARWRAEVPQVIRRALQWIAETLGTRHLIVWPHPDWTAVDHWRHLWRAVVHRLPSGRTGGWLAGSVLWGWLGHHTQCRAGTARPAVYGEGGGESAHEKAAFRAT